MNISLSCFDSLGSTSSYARKLLAEGQSPPFAIQADEQTQGVGQRGKTWTSPKGNLYLSLVIPNSRLEIKSRGLIPLKVACLISNWLVGEFGIHPIIKWPNDLYFAGKKLAGILCQTSVKSDSWGDLFIGIGINVSHAPEISGANYQSISLTQIKAKSFEIKALAQSLVDYWGRKWFATSEEEVCAQYARFSAVPFSLWKERQGRKTIVHRELGIDSDGGLCLQELGIQSDKVPKKKKLTSANHSLSNLFLNKNSSPFLVACQWQNTLYLALFADRFQVKPLILHELTLSHIAIELDRSLQILRQNIDKILLGSGETMWPVSYYGSVFRENQQVAKKFELYGFVLFESSANPRLSKGFEGGDDVFVRLRLAAAESWLERKRLRYQGSDCGVILNWSEMLGFADQFNEEGRLIRTLNSRELAQLESDLDQKKAYCAELVGCSYIFHYVLHGLMLLAIG